MGVASPFCTGAPAKACSQAPGFLARRGGIAESGREQKLILKLKVRNKMSTDNKNYKFLYIRNAQLQYVCKTT